MGWRNGSSGYDVGGTARAGANTVHIMKAESPGPDPGKLVPRIGKAQNPLSYVYWTNTYNGCVSSTGKDAPL